MGLFMQTILFSIIRQQHRTISRHATTLTKLAEVGRLDAPKAIGKYETGQLFLHRVFGYRGVILFPWTARVYDRDVQLQENQKKAATAAATAAAAGPSPDKPQNPADTGTSSTSSKKTRNNSKNWREPSMSASENVEISGDSESNVGNTDSQTHANTSSTSTNTEESVKKDAKAIVHTFYQVLIDSRDCPFIRAQTEAVTFLGNQDSNRSLYAIPGLDYVAHDDIMPYSSTERHPLHHELFDKFLSYTPEQDPTFRSQETLQAWQEKNYPWLELSDVHRETTENIRVTVIPFYMGCRETPASSVYWWRYCIRLENLGNLSVQLRERHWRIFSLSGTLETVRGRGVVGQEPILSRRLPAFQYSSHVSLQAPSGHMWGTFRLEREDGHTFDCKIPPFSLESKPEDHQQSPDNNSGNNNSPQLKANEKPEETN